MGCNSRYLDLEDRLDTEILISFRDSSLSLLYIIVVSRFVEIFLFRDFITMQIEYIDRIYIEYIDTFFNIIIFFRKIFQDRII